MKEATVCSEKKHPGGKLVKICLNVIDDSVKGVVLTGDFFAEPEEVLEEVVEKLLLLECRLREVKEKVLEILVNSNIRIYGLTLQDFSEALDKAMSEVGKVS